jgi:hypothetical protein
VTRGAPPATQAAPPPLEGATTASAHGRVERLRSWTADVDVLFSPYAVALAVYVPLLLLFLATPASVFDARWSTTKYTSAAGIAFYGLAIAAFVLGALVGDVLARRRDDDRRPLSAELAARFRVVLALALAVAIAAYATWFALAIWRAGGLGGFADALVTDPELVRQTLFASVPGVTTLTQLALAAIPLALAFRLLDRRLLAPLAATALALALAVALLGNFRLTFLELAVVVGYLVLSGRRMSLGRLVLLAAGVVLVVAAFFIVAEIRRRGPYEPYGIGDAAIRFFSYYLNSINNTFAIVANHTFALPLYFSTQPFWEFPGVSSLVRYEDVFNVDADLFLDDVYRANGLTRSVTTFGLPGESHVELGWVALWQILGLGGVAGALYRVGRRDRFFRALYAVWLVGMLEFVRINYFLEPRMVPVYALFALVFVVVVRPAARAPAAQEAPP